MKKRILTGLVTGLLAASALLAHQGHAHALLGSIERVRPCHFVMKTKEGEIKTIFVTSTTRVERGGAAILPSELAAGTRVSVEVEDDGETAVSVKTGGAK